VADGREAAARGKRKSLAWLDRTRTLCNHRTCTSAHRGCGGTERQAAGGRAREREHGAVHATKRLVEQKSRVRTRANRSQCAGVSGGCRKAEALASMATRLALLASLLLVSGGAAVQPRRALAEEPRRPRVHIYDLPAHLTEPRWVRPRTVPPSPPPTVSPVPFHCSTLGLRS
jgi:hypothetical protein